MNIEKDPKYQLFFEVLDEEHKKYIEIKNNTIFINHYNCCLNFDKKKHYSTIEIPNIESSETITIYDANCNELIFNNIKVNELYLCDNNFNSLKFKSHQESFVRYFIYKNYEANTSNRNKLIKIPANINFREISINDNNNNNYWEIEDNKYLNSIEFKYTNIHKINKYDSVNKIEIKNTNLNFDNFGFDEMESLKKIIYTNTKELSEKINVCGMENLIELSIYIENKSMIELENLSNLHKLVIENSKNDYNLVNLDKINSTFLSSLTINGFKIQDTKSIIYDDKIIELDIPNNSKEYIKGESISILLKDKTFNFYSPKKDNILDFIEIKEKYFDDDSCDNDYDESWYFHITDLIKEFLCLMKSTNLMTKLFYNNLNAITKEDLLTINQEDIKGFKAISYCRTIEALKMILKHKDYHLNNNDITLLSNEKLKSFYQKELIKSNIPTIKNFKRSLKNKKIL